MEINEDDDEPATDEEEGNDDEWTIPVPVRMRSAAVVGLCAGIVHGSRYGTSPVAEVTNKIVWTVH